MAKCKVGFGYSCFAEYRTNDITNTPNHQPFDEKPTDFYVNYPGNATMDYCTLYNDLLHLRTVVVGTTDELQWSTAAAQTLEHLAACLVPCLPFPCRKHEVRRVIIRRKGFLL